MAWLKREIALDFAEHGMHAEIGGGVCGNNGYDVAIMSGEFIVAAGAEIPVIKDLAAAGIGLDEGSGDRFQSHISADGRDFDVTVANVGEGDGTAHGVDVDVPVAHVVDVNDSVDALKAQVAVEMFGGERTGGGTEAQGCVRRNEDFVVDAAALLIGAVEKMGDDLDAIAALLGIDLGFVGLKGGANDDFIGVAGLDRNAAVLGIDGDVGLGTDRVAVFLFGFGDGDRNQTGGDDNDYHLVARNTLHRNTPLGPAMRVNACFPSFSSTALLTNYDCCIY